MMKDNIKITHLTDETPSYVGYSEIIRFDNRYFRTRDAEGYSSWLDEITEKEYNRLLKYESKES